MLYRIIQFFYNIVWSYNVIIHSIFPMLYTLGMVSSYIYRPGKHYIPKFWKSRSGIMFFLEMKMMKSQSKLALGLRGNQRIEVYPPQLVHEILGVNSELYCELGAQILYHSCQVCIQKCHRIDHGSPMGLVECHGQSSEPLRHSPLAAIHWQCQAKEPWKISSHGISVPTRLTCSCQFQQKYSKDL